MKIPGTFYKYRSLAGDGAKFLKTLLTLNEIYLSAPEQFNDPFDCSPTFDFSCTKEEAEALADRTLARDTVTRTPEELRVAKERFLASFPIPNLDEAYEHMRAAHERAVREAMGVYSLSARVDSPLLWSHYADSHHGLCIGFHPDAYPFNIAQQVVYSQIRGAVNPFNQAPDQVLANSILQKSEDWTYEAEWRIALPNAARKSISFENGAITEIIFGARMLHEHQDLVRSWISGHRPKFFQARISTRTFAIEIDRLQT
jgi:hypothetical protein